MMISTWGRFFWPWYLAVMSLLLLGPEIYALNTNPRNTLSDWVWTELAVSTDQQLPWTAAHYLVFWVWVVVFSWLTWHFFFRRFT